MWSMGLQGASSHSYASLLDLPTKREVCDIGSGIPGGCWMAETLTKVLAGSGDLSRTQGSQVRVDHSLPSCPLGHACQAEIMFMQAGALGEYGRSTTEGCRTLPLPNSPVRRDLCDRECSGTPGFTPAELGLPWGAGAWSC